ncbi:hypothetical protein R1flu_006436 [Riccia fluitans]|uniref:Uncharacterized protein n=1 Tax=Riccia fluitans TaxID=41844 RepID=A0ABD1Z028_9MARC
MRNYAAVRHQQNSFDDYFPRVFNYFYIQSEQQQQEPDIKMASEQERKEMDARAQAGEEVVKGGRGGKSLDAQKRLAEGRSKGGQTRATTLGEERYQEMGQNGNLTAKEEEEEQESGKEAA